MHPEPLSEPPRLGLPPSALRLLFRSLQGSDGGAMAAPWRRHKGISSVPKKRCATTWGKVGWGAGQLNNSNRCDLLIFIEGSLEVKLLEKQRWEESEKRKAKERSSEKRKNQKKEDAGAQKTRKVAKHRVFSNVLWLRQVRSHLGMKNCTPAWREADLEVKMLQTPQPRNALWA